MIRTKELWGFGNFSSCDPSSPYTGNWISTIATLFLYCHVSGVGRHPRLGRHSLFFKKNAHHPFLSRKLWGLQNPSSLLENPRRTSIGRGNVSPVFRPWYLPWLGLWYRKVLVQTGRENISRREHCWQSHAQNELCWSGVREGIERASE